MSTDSAYVDMLVPILRQGRLVYQLPEVEQIRKYAHAQLSFLHPSIKRLLNPHQYPVGLERGLHNLKTELIMQARSQTEHQNPSLID
jgi:nicotinate phosphoribosyltransferase